MLHKLCARQVTAVTHEGWACKHSIPASPSLEDQAGPTDFAYVKIGRSEIPRASSPMAKDAKGCEDAGVAAVLQQPHAWMSVLGYVWAESMILIQASCHPQKFLC